MNKNKFKYKRVKVIWQDICSSSQWYDDLKDVDDFTYSWCEDIGYLYYKDSKVVKIFTSFSYDSSKLSIGNITAYPKSIVKKIIHLK